LFPGFLFFWRLALLLTQRLLSSTNVHEILGVSREGLRKMRARGAAPKAERCGSVSITRLDDFVSWIAKELARATRSRFLRRLAK
jgi:hypothetical protein